MLDCSKYSDVEKNCAVVANIQRFTIHDGPGIRTELFLKGCPLRCEWCSNPETYERYPQVGVFSEKCIGCGYCLKACEEHGKNAIKIGVERVIGINRELCDNCLLCEEECVSGALTVWGKKMTVEEAMDVIRRDRDFYEKSGGGVTLSGGEALLQWEFCRDLLKCCKEEGINTCLESALHVNPKFIDEVAPYVDLFITDIKQMDGEIHKKFTGVGNELILRNIKKIIEIEIPLIIRMPIIPGFNDNIEYIDQTSEYILNVLHNKPQLIQLLKYRPLGEEKCKTLDLPKLMKGIKIEDREGFEIMIRSYVKRMNEKGIPAIAGTKEKPSMKNKEKDMKDYFGLQNKVCVVTGAASGMGAATVEMLIDLGAKVYALDWAEVTNSGIEQYIKVNLGSKEDIDAAFEQIPEMIDCFYGCAGVSGQKQDYETTVKINFVSNKYITNEYLVNRMQKGSAICFISSEIGYNWKNKELFEEYKEMVEVSGGWSETVEVLEKLQQKNTPGVLGYALSKRALNYFTSCMVGTLAQKGIRINAIAPGGTKSGLTDDFAKTCQGMDNLIMSTGPAGRLAEAKEMAMPLVFLSSNMASYLSGANVFIGYNMHDLMNLGLIPDTVNHSALL